MKPSNSFKLFYQKYEGSFWNKSIPYEILDIIEGKSNIESYTLICREKYNFPNKLIILSELSESIGLVLNTQNDKIYEVDFFEDIEALLNNNLEEKWKSFQLFLEEYFYNY